MPHFVTPCCNGDGFSKRLRKLRVNEWGIELNYQEANLPPTEVDFICTIEPCEELVDDDNEGLWEEVVEKVKNFELEEEVLSPWGSSMKDWQIVRNCTIIVKFIFHNVWWYISMKRNSPLKLLL